MAPSDPVALTAALIRCPSVTPADAGAMDVLEPLLTAGGFACTRVDRGGIANLFARWGARGAARSFGFCGHTDVVPVGDAAWTADPFRAEVRDGWMYGRGAVDMKSGVAAFVAAALDFVRTAPPEGAVVLLITGDEEGMATDGTLALLDWMAAQGEAMTDCLVGEPTCPDIFGEMIKIGRRGSLTAHVTLRGLQGHAAYPDRARNPVAAMARLIDRLAHHRFDDGSGPFEPSSLVVTTIDTGNTASNVIPATCRATLNIRFNDLHTGAGLTRWLQDEVARTAAETGTEAEVAARVSGEAFITPPGALSALVAAAVRAETGVVPVLSTSGGTSDARFIRAHCPVVEFGLVGRSMHQIDERVDVAQIGQLKAVYARILRDYFA